MKILVACEESQAVTIELRKLGHEAYSCDIEPCSGGHPEWHIQGDVIPLIKAQWHISTTTQDGNPKTITGGWDMILAFPPCTYLSNAGNRWLYQGGKLNEERYKKGLDAKEFFMTILNADCPKMALENPIHAKIYDMPLHSQDIQPWMFGHPVTKRTRLWLKGLPNLAATEIVEPTRCFLPSSRSGENGLAARTSKARSKTFPGIAKAMAEQWAGDNR